MNEKIIQIIFILLASAIIANAFRFEFKRRNYRNKVLSKRNSISIDEIFLLITNNDELDMEVFKHLWIEIASILHVNPEKLRPKDRFSQELLPMNGTEHIDDVEDLSEFLLSLSEKHGINTNIHNIDDIESIIRIFTKKKKK